MFISYIFYYAKMQIEKNVFIGSAKAQVLLSVSKLWVSGMMERKLWIHVNATSPSLPVGILKFKNLVVMFVHVGSNGLMGVTGHDGSGV